MQLHGNKILITGGATGIGLGLTQRFNQEGNKVIICGRREEVLQQVAAQYPEVITHVCDLTKEEDRLALYNWIKTNHPDLNVLVNNAGIQNRMGVADADFYQQATQEMAINVEAPVHLAHLFLQLPSLRTIINVTSGLAFVPMADAPIYCATKAFMRSFTLSLRHQLRDRQIEVIEMIPPGLNTDLGGKGLHTAFPSVDEFVEAIFQQLQEGKTELTFGTSEQRAKANNETIRDYFKMMNP